MPKPSFPDEIEFRGLNMPIHTESSLRHLVVEADAIGKGPIAKVALPFRLRQQVHGWWVPQAALDAAK